MPARDTILTINVVEPALVRAVNLHSKTMGKNLKGLALVHTDYADFPGRPQDSSGLFTEIICDFNDPNELQRVLKPHMKNLLAVTCRYEEAIQPFGQVIPFLPYIHTPSANSLLWASDKPLMRDRLRNYDPNLVPKYQYMQAHDLPKLEELTKDFNFPVIVKPGGLADSWLVERCATKEELYSRLVHTFKIINDVYVQKGYPGKPSVLVEEMMQGEMYSVDAYVTHDGDIYCLPMVKVITGHAIGLPGFYTHRTIIPIGLPETEIQAAFAASRAAVRALNLSASTAHIELFRTAEGWKIIELGARIGGFRDALYREAYGIEHFYNDLAVRMGKLPTMPGEPIAHAAGLHLYADEEGYIESIEGIEEARNLASVVHLDLRVKVGDLTQFAGNGGHVPVDIILSNKDAEQLEKDITKIKQLVKLKIKQSTGSSTTKA